MVSHKQAEGQKVQTWPGRVDILAGGEHVGGGTRRSLLVRFCGQALLDSGQCADAERGTLLHHAAGCAIGDGDWRYASNLPSTVCPWVYDLCIRSRNYHPQSSTSSASSDCACLVQLLIVALL